VGGEGVGGTGDGVGGVGAGLRQMHFLVAASTPRQSESSQSPPRNGRTAVLAP
jgi:hypothetical protein